MFTKEFKDFFEANREYVKKKKRWGRYIHRVNFSMIESHVPANVKFLAIGPWVSKSLLSLRDSTGVVVDPYCDKADSESMPKIKFFSNFEHFKDSNEKFDYIILSFSIGMMEDIIDSFIDLRRFCTSHTRIISTYYSRAWQPFIKAAEFTGLKFKMPEMNWVPLQEIENLMFLADFQIIKRSLFCLVPTFIPLLSNFVNKFISPIPFINLFGILTIEVGRPLHLPDNHNRRHSPKVSVVVAAKNEEMNIPFIVKRIPSTSFEKEIIFVEGGSKDRTREAIEKVIADNPSLDIKFLTQDGKGKKDAIEKGFNAAQGDILIILDADLTVCPESLPKFVHALISDKAEFINGSRMVYPMRGKAMRFCNLLGNIFFSWIFSYLINQQIRDTLCGTKAFWRKDYLHIVENRRHFGQFDPFGDFDLLFGATYINLKIVDLPVRYEERRYGDTNIRRWRDGFYLLRMVIVGLNKLKFNWLSMRTKAKG
ncbi:MAG: glycosyltransferase family 2 protein [Candidatus Omnitrophica bacterium]|nr:glycosyltransferase family 2 protein [Candidatus Omnitrophota bacterium]